MKDNKINYDEHDCNNNTVIPEYADLQSLVFQNADARQYYNELPKKVREQLKANSNDINNYESLQSYAEDIKRINEI